MSIRQVNGPLFRCFLLPTAPVLREVFSLLRVSRHTYTGGIPKELSVSHGAQAQTPPNTSLFVFSMPKEFQL